MGKYVAGPSVLRFPGRPAVIPGEAFAHVFDDPAHEAMALASGAIRLQPGETSLTDQIAATEAVDQAALAAAAALSGSAPNAIPADPEAPASTTAPESESAQAESTDTARSASASRRRTRSSDDTQKEN